MNAPTQQRPVSVTEMRRAWSALLEGEFRTGATGSQSGSAMVWCPTATERVIAVLGCIGSAGASTVTLAAAQHAASTSRIIDCGSITTSGLGLATTAELGIDEHGWRRGRRDQLQVDRSPIVLGGPDQLPIPAPAPSECVTSFLDVGWEAGQVLSQQRSWLATAVRNADAVVLVTTATVPGLRRAEGVLELLRGHPSVNSFTLAVRGPARRKWPKAVEATTGYAVRQMLTEQRYVEIPVDAGLATHGLGPGPLPASVAGAGRRVLDAVAGAALPVHPLERKLR